MSVFRPIAAIARIMKNLLSSLKGVNMEEGTPKFIAIVVIIEANIKYIIKIGKIFLKFSSFPLVFLSFLERINARVSVIGMMAKVLVNLTVTALSIVVEPKWNMLSQVEEAAVTEEVSLIAVPAKIPKASPEVCEKPNQVPKTGNKIAAMRLNKKITEIA
jgi:hypothetical protein